MDVYVLHSCTTAVTMRVKVVRLCLERSVKSWEIPLFYITAETTTSLQQQNSREPQSPEQLWK